MLISHSQLHVDLRGKKPILNWILKPMEVPKPILLPPKRWQDRSTLSLRTPGTITDRCGGPLASS